MKKISILMVLFMFFCGFLWGVDFSLSTGAGGLFGGYFTRYKSSSTSDSGRMTQDVNQLNYGALAFFDATYGVLTVAFQGGSSSYDEVMSKNGKFVPLTGEGWETVLGISLLGKYPFTFNDRIKLYPLLGLEYQRALSERRRQSGGPIYDRTNGLQEQDKDGKAFDVSAWNSFWIQLGGGMDFSVSGSIFARGELLYGFRLMTSYEKDGLEQLKAMLNDNDPKLSGLTSGPSIRISVGYRLWG